jgi:hypothetical protein
MCGDEMRTSRRSDSLERCGPHPHVEGTPQTTLGTRALYGAGYPSALRRSEVAII